MNALRVAILVPDGDPSRPDMEDTFVQAREIAACLRALGHGSTEIRFAADRARTRVALAAFAPDMVFNLVEDLPEGADQLHLATALLDELTLPYTGARTKSLKALGDKEEMKARMQERGLPVAPGVDEDDASTLYIVKSIVEHASVGLDSGSVVTGAAAARARITERESAFGGRWFAERYIHGREFNVALIETSKGVRVLPLAEIRFEYAAEGEPRIVGYAEKWDPQSPGYHGTPRHFPKDAGDWELLAQLDSLSRAAWTAFDLAGYARVDFRIDEQGQPFILEVNANPCLSSDAGFCAAAAELGLSQTDITAHVIAAAR